MTQAVTPMVAEALPRLRELVGDRALRTRRDEFERLGLPLLWQTERDLQLLGRKVPAEHLRRAYQSLLRNADQVLDAAYEIRAAAMLVPFVDAIELSPKIGSGRCDMKCRVHVEQLLYFSPEVHEQLKECRPRRRDLDQFYLSTRYADAVPDLLAAEPSAEEARTSITAAKDLVSRIRDLIGKAS